MNFIILAVTYMYMVRSPVKCMFLFLIYTLALFFKNKITFFFFYKVSSSSCSFLAGAVAASFVLLFSFMMTREFMFPALNWPLLLLPLVASLHTWKNSSGTKSSRQKRNSLLIIFKHFLLLNFSQALFNFSLLNPSLSRLILWFIVFFLPCCLIYLFLSFRKYTHTYRGQKMTLVSNR